MELNLKWIMNHRESGPCKKLILSNSAPRPMVRIGPESKDVATKRGITLRTVNVTK
jgi:hypothetical protein